jgi:hypothetical protein
MQIEMVLYHGCHLLGFADVCGKVIGSKEHLLGAVTIGAAVLISWLIAGRLKTGHLG